MAKQKKFKKVVKFDSSKIYVEYYAIPYPKKVSLSSIIFHPFLCLLYGLLCLIVYPLYLIIMLTAYIKGRKVYFEEV